MTWFSAIVLIVFISAYFYRDGKEAAEQKRWEESRRAAEVPGE